MSFTKRERAPATTRGHAVHLGEDPKGENFLYTNGRSVIIRSIKDQFVASQYTQHTAPATVARYAPSGFYIASGDERGNIRIWDTINSENILKTETRPLAGRINDIAWDGESKRLIAVGEGKDKFAHAFLFDTASSVGEMSGHSKTINAVSMRASRPFKAVTASDDMSVNFYPGVPFKFEKSLKDHGRFVQCVRYSPSGDYFVSGGMDAKLFLYDGKTGDLVAELADPANGHTGGIFSVSWSKDSTRLLSCSSDTTVKIWDIATRSVVQTFNVGVTPGLVENQQVGCLWQGDYIISLSLNGNINYFDKSSSSPIRVVKGHQKAITALAAVPSTSTFYTGSYDGQVHAWSIENGTAIHHDVSGAGHSNQIKGLVADKSGKVVSIGMDDTVITIDNAGKSFSSNAVGTDGVPVGVASCNGVTVVVTITGNISVKRDGAQVASLSVPWVPTAVALNPSATVIAIGDEDKRIRIFSLDLSILQEVDRNRGSITSLSFSPDGTMLASADKERMILVKITQWMFHNARVNCIAWSPDSLHAVSGSLDTNVEVWSVQEPTKHISIKGAHLEGVNCAAFLDNNTVVSAELLAKDREERYQLSRARVANWNNTISGHRRQKLATRADRIAQEEAQRIELDRQHAAADAERRAQLIKRAATAQYHNRDAVKTFHSKVLLYNVLKVLCQSMRGSVNVSFPTQERDMQLQMKQHTAREARSASARDKVVADAEVAQSIRTDAEKAAADRLRRLALARDQMLQFKEKLACEAAERAALELEQKEFVRRDEEHHRLVIDREKKRRADSIALRDQLLAQKHDKAVRIEADSKKDADLEERCQAWALRKSRQVEMKKEFEKRCDALQRREKIGLVQAKIATDADEKFEASLLKASAQKEQETLRREELERQKKVTQKQELKEYYENYKRQNQAKQALIKQQEKELLDHYLKIKEQADQENRQRKINLLHTGMTLHEFHKTQVVSYIGAFRPKPIDTQERIVEVKRAEKDEDFAYDRTAVEAAANEEKELSEYMKKISEEEWAKDNPRLTRFIKRTLAPPQKKILRSAQPVNTKERLGFVPGRYRKPDLARMNPIATGGYLQAVSEENGLAAVGSALAAVSIL
ncbi:hypothetical protein HDU82_005132 [Entophlyctis luteolus]|nr:hypothetical protein HDU82_005132 [Entophlyctis luteolus]